MALDDLERVQPLLLLLLGLDLEDYGGQVGHVLLVRGPHRFRKLLVLDGELGCPPDAVDAVVVLLGREAPDGLLHRLVLLVEDVVGSAAPR